MMPSWAEERTVAVSLGKYPRLCGVSWSFRKAFRNKTGTQIVTTAFFTLIAAVQSSVLGMTSFCVDFTVPTKYSTRELPFQRHVR